MPSLCVLHSAKPIATPFSLLGYKVEASRSSSSVEVTANESVQRSSHQDNLAAIASKDHLQVCQLLVTVPDTEAPAVIASVPNPNASGDTVSETTSRLDDLLLLLSLAHGHDIVRVRHTPDNIVATDNSVANTPTNMHHYTFGRVLTSSLGRYAINLELPTEHPYTWLEHCYTTLQNPAWQHFYHQGRYLRLVQSLAQQSNLTAALNHAWLLLEHLFALHNAHWLTTHHVRTLTPFEKLSFLVASYVLTPEKNHAGEVPQPSTTPGASNQQRLKRYAQVLNQLVYHAHVPSSLSQAAFSFISLIEYCCLAALYDTRFVAALDATSVLNNASPHKLPSLPRFHSLRQFEDICRDPIALARHLHADDTELVTSLPS
jgi:hypothetical protein